VRRLLIANALLFLLAGPAPAQWNDDAEKCAETSIPDLTLARCTRAIQSGELSEPSMAVTLNNRGNAYQNKGDYARAIADYDQAIKLHSDSALIYSNRGRAHQQRGDYERAIQDYEQAIRLDPTSARGFTNAGACTISKKITRRPSRTTTRRSRSIRPFSSLSTTGPSPASIRGSSPPPCLTSPGPSSSTPRGRIACLACTWPRLERATSIARV